MLRQSALSADLINVFEVFLPQLLLYPNPSDPLNGEAAALLMREPQTYNQRVRGELQMPLALVSGWRWHLPVMLLVELQSAISCTRCSASPWIYRMLGP